LIIATLGKVPAKLKFENPGKDSSEEAKGDRGIEEDW